MPARLASAAGITTAMSWRCGEILSLSDIDILFTQGIGGVRIMKRGVTELNHLGTDIGSNLPKEPRKNTYERAREEMRPHDAYALPRLASVSDVDSGRLTGGAHIPGELRSPQRRRTGLDRLYRMYLAELEASQSRDPTALKAVMAIASVRPRMH